MNHYNNTTNDEYMDNEMADNEMIANEMMENEDVEDDFDTLPKVIVIDQPYTERYPLSEALRRGTLFPILKMPYMIQK